MAAVARVKCIGKLSDRDTGSHQPPRRATPAEPRSAYSPNEDPAHDGATVDGLYLLISSNVRAAGSCYPGDGRATDAIRSHWDADVVCRPLDRGGSGPDA